MTMTNAEVVEVLREMDTRFGPITKEDVSVAHDIVMLRKLIFLTVLMTMNGVMIGMMVLGPEIFQWPLAMAITMYMGLIGYLIGTTTYTPHIKKSMFYVLTSMKEKDDAEAHRNFVPYSVAEIVEEE